MKPTCAVGLMIALAVAYVSLSQGQQPPQATVVAGSSIQRWEYKSLDYDETALNNAGSEGWEAYAVTTASNGSRVAYLRRHKQWEPSSNQTVPLVN